MLAGEMLSPSCSRCLLARMNSRWYSRLQSRQRPFSPVFCAVRACFPDLQVFLLGFIAELDVFIGGVIRQLLIWVIEVVAHGLRERSCGDFLDGVEDEWGFVGEGLDHERQGVAPFGFGMSFLGSIVPVRGGPVCHFPPPWGYDRVGGESTSSQVFQTEHLQMFHLEHLGGFYAGSEDGEASWSAWWWEEGEAGFGSADSGSSCGDRPGDEGAWIGSGEGIRHAFPGDGTEGRRHADPDADGMVEEGPDDDWEACGQDGTERSHERDGQGSSHRSEGRAPSGQAVSEAPGSSWGERHPPYP